MRFKQLRDVGEKVEERELALEQRRVKEAAEKHEELHPRELDECPTCLESVKHHKTARFLCCGNCTCVKCKGTNKINQCPLCRANFPSTNQDKVGALQKFADKSVGWAMHCLVGMHEDGENGSMVNKQVAFQLCRRAADQGHAPSMCKTV